MISSHINMQNTSKKCHSLYVVTNVIGLSADQQACKIVFLVCTRNGDDTDIFLRKVIDFYLLLKGKENGRTFLSVFDSRCLNFCIG